MEKKIYEIAIIDDEVEILQLLDKYLKRTQEYRITTFSNPKVALDSCIRTKYDLILLDIMMPGMDGLEFLEGIKKEIPSQKVCMMTAYSTLDKVLKSHKQGAENYIMKPFPSLDALGQKVRTLLEK
ncbi:response regulator [Halarcobacter bivalviorum]|uniref:response regulator n=1 Tax=Halarcobacter bivalviorum TaxID=663364 RepID=UPI00100A47A5|nr:response regulator [Halarcobacter bivalviorum]RXK05256.1 response regulator [Halarcobacter bivalviorum]